MYDFNFSDHGSIAVLYPVTAEAHAWAEEHLPDDGPRWNFGYAIEHRYARDILVGLTQDGLTVGRL